MKKTFQRPCRPRTLLPSLLLAAAALLLMTMSGCRTIGIGRPDADAGPAAAAAPGAEPEFRNAAGLNRLQNRLVEGAYFVRGKQQLRVNGRNFNNDCTGTVLAIYWYAGIDLAQPLSRYTGNGVSRLYQYLEDARVLMATRDPAAGDIIFWDNTYDRNGDSRPNDFLTHTGMVVGVEKDGTIHYVHHNYRKGVVFARMNLYSPDVYTEEVEGRPIIVNSPMRMRGSPDYDKWLASELTRNFGQAWRMF
jgi:hypothetical protein